VNSRVAALLLATFLIDAQAATVCRLVSGNSVAFGAYDILSSSPNDTLVSVDVACDRDGGPANVSVNVGLNQGTNGTSVNARRLARVGGGDYLAYGLYRDVGRSAVWGFSSGVDTVTHILNVPNKGTASTTFTIYGRMPANQDVMAGSYSDTVQITVSP
jgi:spore coat protein U-like protein